MSAYLISAEPACILALSHLLRQRPGMSLHGAAWLIGHEGSAESLFAELSPHVPAGKRLLVCEATEGWKLSPNLKSVREQRA